MIRRFLINAYQLGYDRVNITHENPKQYHHIQHKIPELLGYEIIERTNEGCVIKNIASRINIDFKSSIKKIFLLTNGMVNNLHESYKINNKQGLANLHYKDVYINKYSSFCLRMINKETYTGYPSSQIHTIYHMIITIENLADYYKKLAKLLVNFPKDKDVSNLLLKLKNYFEENHELFFKPTREKILKSRKIYQNINGIIKRSFYKTKDSKKLLILTLLNNITRTTYHLTSKNLMAIKL